MAWNGEVKGVVAGSSAESRLDDDQELHKEWS